LSVVTINDKPIQNQTNEEVKFNALKKDVSIFKKETK
jgi:hypothetical protein